MRLPLWKKHDIQSINFALEFAFDHSRHVFWIVSGPATIFTIYFCVEHLKNEDNFFSWKN